jgi:hypothetical protein
MATRPFVATLRQYAAPGELLDDDAVQRLIDQHLGFAPPANEAALERIVTTLRPAVPRGVVITLRGSLV